MNAEAILCLRVVLSCRPLRYSFIHHQQLAFVQAELPTNRCAKSDVAFQSERQKFHEVHAVEEDFCWVADTAVMRKRTCTHSIRITHFLFDAETLCTLRALSAPFVMIESVTRTSGPGQAQPLEVSVRYRRVLTATQLNSRAPFDVVSSGLRDMCRTMSSSREA